MSFHAAGIANPAFPVLERALDQSNGPLDCLDHVRYGNMGGTMGERIPALATLSRVHLAALAQQLEQLDDRRPWNPRLLGQVARCSKIFLLLREAREDHDRVIG